MSRLKQFFCTHYHAVTATGLPLYDMFPKKTVWPIGDFLRVAKRDLDAWTCLNCGMKYFDTNGHDTILTSAMDARKGWFPGKPMLIMPREGQRHGCP